MSHELRLAGVTMTKPCKVCAEGRSKMRLLLVKIGFLAKADTSVSFYFL
jgi:hypothetical protein